MERHRVGRIRTELEGERPSEQFLIFLREKVDAKYQTTSEFQKSLELHGRDITSSSVDKWLRGSMQIKFDDLEYIALALGYKNHAALLRAYVRGK